MKRREAPSSIFGSSFYMFFLLLLSLPYVKWSSQVDCFTLGPHSGPRTFLCSIFAGFSLLHLLATAILDSFFLFYLPNISPSRNGRPSSLGIGALRSLWLLPAELGWRGTLDFPLLLVSSLRVLIAVPI